MEIRALEADLDLEIRSSAILETLETLERNQAFPCVFKTPKGGVLPQSTDFHGKPLEIQGWGIGTEHGFLRKTVKNPRVGYCCGAWISNENHSKSKGGVLL